jgi:hypothetical protein
MPIIGYKPNFNELFREHYNPNAQPKYDDYDVDDDVDDGNDYSQGANQAYYDKLMKQHKEREERRNAHTLSKVISSPSRRKSISTILSTHTDPLILGDFVISRSNRRGSRSKSRSKSRSRSNDDKPPPISGGKSRRVFRRKMTSRRRQRRSTRSKHKH